jgi:RNA polymerase sigma-70 factor (ECF subfamily)
MPEGLLWEAFKNGDEIAFVAIYNKYATLLFDYGCRYSSDKEMVRDCLQDFFLYLKKNKKGFSETNSIKNYLFKAFRRRVVEYRKKNAVGFSLDQPFDHSLNPSESGEAIYINKQVKADQLEKLDKALTTLDSKEREAIYYFYFKGLSYEQIAERLKFAHVSSARRVMYRSIKQLRSFLMVGTV